MGTKKNSIIFLCLSLVVSSLLAAPGVGAKAPEIVQRQKRAVVAVSVNDKKGEQVASGSGFVVDPRGIIATSCHIIIKWFEKADHALVVRMEDGSSFPMEHLLSNNCNNNLALVKVKANGLHAVKLAADYKPKNGEHISVIDKSPGREAAASDGVIKDVFGKGGFFQIGLPFKPGHDGSPVFNSAGEVIGLSTMLPSKKKSRPAVVPARYISREFNEHKGLLKEAPQLPPPDVPITPPQFPSADVPVASQPLKEDAGSAFLAGRSFEADGKFKEAVEAYKNAARINPDYAEAYVHLGLVYYRLGRYAEAVDAYKQVIKLRPHDPSLYNKLGAAYIIIGEYQKAIDAFENLIKIEPNNSEAHFNLGVAFIIAGNKKGAMDVYVTLKKLDRSRAEELLDFFQ